MGCNVTVNVLLVIITFLTVRVVIYLVDLSSLWVQICFAIRLALLALSLIEPITVFSAVDAPDSLLALHTASSKIHCSST